jgi:hypothetical protein
LQFGLHFKIQSENPQSISVWVVPRQC